MLTPFTIYSNKMLTELSIAFEPMAIRYIEKTGQTLGKRKEVSRNQHLSTRLYK